MMVKTATNASNPQREALKKAFIDRLQLECSVAPDQASDKQIYQTLSAMMVAKLKVKRLSIKTILSAERAYITFPWNF